MAKVEDVAQMIKRLQHRHHRTMDTRLASLGITLVQWDALRAISRTPDASSHHLAQVTFQTDQSFGTLANRLESRGLIVRTAGSGRAIRHRLTPAGEALLQAGYALVHDVQAESFAPLNTAEIDTLHDLLSRLLGEPGHSG